MKIQKIIKNGEETQLKVLLAYGLVLFVVFLIGAALFIFE